MTQDQILISHARDLKEQCADNSMITSTAFLDLRQRALLAPLEKEQREFVRTVFFGGYPDAERTAAVFIPSFFEFEDETEFFAQNEEEIPIVLIEIEKDRFSSLSHRDYLGALMGLGIKREMLGDLLVTEKGCFVPCVKSVARFIEENLTGVGRGTVKARRVPFDSLASREEKFVTVSACVASVRLDNMVSAAFSVSRNASVQAIEKGLVYVDGVQITKPDHRIAEGEKLVFRGKGKAVFERITGESKKGRVHVCFKRYI